MINIMSQMMCEMLVMDWTSEANIKQTCSLQCTSWIRNTEHLEEQYRSDLHTFWIQPAVYKCLRDRILHYRMNWTVDTLTLMHPHTQIYTHAHTWQKKKRWRIMNCCSVLLCCPLASGVSLLGFHSWLLLWSGCPSCWPPELGEKINNTSDWHEGK